MKNNTTITTPQVTDIIREFSADFERRRWTKGEVCDLRERLETCETVEEARILAFCEVAGYQEPDAGEFATLEEFKRQLEEEGEL